MEKETLNKKPCKSKESCLENSPLCMFDLPILIAKMKLNSNWERGELKAIILIKSPEKQIILTALHEGTEINSFQANDSITLQIIEGKVKFHTRNNSVTLDKGQLLTFHENSKYRLITKEESVLLLTIITGVS